MEKVETLMVTITAVLVGVIIVMDRMVEHTVVTLLEVKDIKLD
jgi:methenyltetrahydromethanopterin cyclohydrolase